MIKHRTLAALLAALTLSACSGGSASGTVGGGSQPATGSLRLLATDKPLDHALVEHARVAVDRVLGHQDAGAESGFVTLYDGPAIELDLLELNNGVVRQLVKADLATGDWSQLRLRVASGELALVNGKVYTTADGSLELTSQATSGFKVKIEPPVAVVGGLTTDLLLDFDLTKTFQPVPGKDPLAATKYHLHPVIHVANLSTTGTLAGTVTQDDGAGLLVPVGMATVWLLPPGVTDTALSIASTVTTPTGAWALLGVAPGLHDVLAEKGAAQAGATGLEVFVGNVTELDLVLP